MSKISSPEKTQEYLQRFDAGVKKRNPGEPEFHQAVHEVAHNIFPYIADKPHYHDMQIMERTIGVTIPENHSHRRNKV